MSEVAEEMLLCKNLETTTKGEDVFKLIDSYFQANKLNWNMVVSVSTDGAAALTGGKIGFKAHVLKVSTKFCCQKSSEKKDIF
jgi:hypothetical protein